VVSNLAAKARSSFTPPPICGLLPPHYPGPVEQRRPDLHAPDYVLVFKDGAGSFLEHLKETMLQFYGDDSQKSRITAESSTRVTSTG